MNTNTSVLDLGLTITEVCQVLAAIDLSHIQINGDGKRATGIVGKATDHILRIASAFIILGKEIEQQHSLLDHPVDQPVLITPEGRRKLRRFEHMHDLLHRWFILEVISSYPARVPPPGSNLSIDVERRVVYFRPRMIHEPFMIGLGFSAPPLSPLLQPVEREEFLSRVGNPATTDGSFGIVHRRLVADLSRIKTTDLNISGQEPPEDAVYLGDATEPLKRMTVLLHRLVGEIGTEDTLYRQGNRKKGSLLRWLGYYHDFIRALGTVEIMGVFANQRFPPTATAFTSRDGRIFHLENPGKIASAPRLTDKTGIPPSNSPTTAHEAFVARVNAAGRFPQKPPQVSTSGHGPPRKVDRTLN